MGMKKKFNAFFFLSMPISFFFFPPDVSQSVFSSNSGPVRLPGQHAEQRRERPVDDDDGGKEERDGRERDVEVALRQRDPVPEDDAVVFARAAFPAAEKGGEEGRDRRGARHEASWELKSDERERASEVEKILMETMK